MPSEYENYEKSNLKLVKHIEEVQANIKSFNNGINGNKYIQHLLSMFRHWYHSQKLNMFAPSKFIGYKNMTCKLYSQLNKHMTGTDTENVLRNKLKLDKKINGPNPLLSDFLNKFGKFRNKRATVTKIKN